MDNFFRQLKTPVGRIVTLLLIVGAVFVAMGIRAELMRFNEPTQDDLGREEIERQLENLRNN